MYRETRIGTRDCLIAAGRAIFRKADPEAAVAAVLAKIPWMDGRDRADVRRTIRPLLRIARALKPREVPGYLAFSGTDPTMQAFNRAWRRRWVRTRKRSVVTQLRLQGDRAMPVVFYLVSSHQDSQPAHADLQGKLLVDRFWRSKLEKADVPTETVARFIRNRKIRTVQWAMGAPCYLLTRPNCRHYLIPVATRYALSHGLGEIKKLVQPRRTGVHRPLTDHDRWVAYLDLRGSVLTGLRKEMVAVLGNKMKK